MADNPLSDRTTQAAHLLRRAGFGGSPSDIANFAALSHTDAVEKLLTFNARSASTFDLERRLRENDYTASLNDMQYWWITAMLHTPQPLQEKMTLFWHGHFTTAYSKVDRPVQMLEQNQLYRNNALGNFKDLVKQVSRNPAMIEYLDGQANLKGKPNENYARELMELFTIGVGNYSEDDVREAARAFTGWGFRGRVFYFNKRQHDEGQKTFMGKTGNFDGDNIIDIILDRPESARFITTALWNYFVYPNPEKAVIDRIADVYTQSKFDIKATMRAIFLSPEFLSAKAYRALVKSPAEYTVGMLKQLDPGAVSQQSARLVNSMGQVLFSPPTVKGWDGGTEWINSNFFFERANGALATTSVMNDDNRPAVIGPVYELKLDSVDKTVDYYLKTLVDGQARPEVKAALTEYFKADGTITDAKIADLASGKTPNKNDSMLVGSKLRGVARLIMSSPEYILN